MTVTEAIDQIVAYSDNVSPAGADDADRRLRILYFLIEEVTQTYYAREWPFRLKGSTAPHVVVAANTAYGLLPTDFLAIGKLGAVYNDSQGGLPMEPAVESEITDLIAMSTQVAGSHIFTVFGMDASNPPRKQIWIPTTSSDVTLRLWYHKVVPTLDEGANVGNLDDAIPVEYHQTVIIPGVRMRARRSKGDNRWTADRDERLQGLNEMIRNNRRMQGGGQQLPSFFGG
jgi:hypothetical protein